MTIEQIVNPIAPEPPSIEHAIESHHDAADNSKTAIWLFIGSEVVFFAVLIGAYMMARWKNPAPHEVLNVPLTSLNSFILLTSSYTVVRALSAIQQNKRTSFLRFTFLSIVFGSIFISIQIFEYASLHSEGLTLSSSLFGSTFFALTGFHGAHVFIGVAWLLRVFYRGFNGVYSANDNWGVEIAALYWHFVDVVWIILFTLIYLN